MALPNQVSEHVLLVEGNDDKQVITHLCNQVSLSVDFKIENKEGLESLLASIPSEILASGRKTVGIIVDANDNPDGRWKSIIARLQHADITAPTHPATTGIVIRSKPKVGVWLMPDNESKGQLEHFVQKMIPDGDTVWPLAQKYIESIPEPEQPKQLIKAQVHAWLAARSKPRRMGTAIRAGDFNIRAPLAEDFINWIQRLFTSTKPDSGN